MAPHKRRSSPRFRVGKVYVYEHHGAWWVYYRDGGQPQRRKIGNSRDEPEQVAAQVNAQLARGTPRLLTFEPIDVSELRRQFLEYHEKVLHSSVGTVRRYITDFDEGKKTPDLAPYFGAELKPADLCRLHGVWHAAFGGK